MTTAFTLTVDQAIEEAIAESGGQPSQYEELRRARTRLNLLLTDWQNRGVNLWKLDLATVTVSASTAQLTLDASYADVLDSVWVKTSTSDLIMSRISYKDYLHLTNKTQTGRPTQFLVERLNGQTRVTLWPVPNETGAIKFWGIKKFNDINGPLDDIDAPNRFMPALMHGLAYSILLSRSKGTPEEEAKLNRIKQEYEDCWAKASEEDRDRSNLRIVPQIGRR